MKNIILKHLFTTILILTITIISNSILYAEENIIQNQNDENYNITFNKQDTPFEEGDTIEVEVKATSHCKVTMKIERTIIEENMTVFLPKI